MTAFEALGRRSSSPLPRCATRVPFMLGGSLAIWARGGPAPHNDLDLMVRPGDAAAALRALADAGMRPERPPEEWLYKAWCGPVLIDLIFEPAGIEMSDALFARADMLPVLAVTTRVMALEDTLAMKLNSLAEQDFDLRRGARPAGDAAGARGREQSTGRADGGLNAFASRNRPRRRGELPTTGGQSSSGRSAERS
jgi:hypothetical protein